MTALLYSLKGRDPRWMFAVGAINLLCYFGFGMEWMEVLIFLFIYLLGFIYLFNKQYQLVYPILFLGHLYMTLIGESEAMTLFNQIIQLVLYVATAYGIEIERNNFMGVRTPWTLKSEENWNFAHAYMTRVLIVLSTIVFNLGLAYPKSWQVILIVEVVVVVGFAFALPYIYKNLNPWKFPTDNLDEPEPEPLT
jgi:uncharacterized membrane protein